MRLVKITRNGCVGITTTEIALQMIGMPINPSNAVSCADVILLRTGALRAHALVREVAICSGQLPRAGLVHVRDCA